MFYEFFIICLEEGDELNEVVGGGKFWGSLG